MNIEQSLNKSLPISQKYTEIIEKIGTNQVLIVAGETGSGKTTQLAKLALLAGQKNIAHTQPRRIAARSVAERIAEELQEKVGESVGYQIRFSDLSSKNTKVKVMTDGILLAEISNDSLLKKYDTIIIDEAHERSLNIDFLLGYLKKILPKRPDLKIIVTSATINIESFSKHFNNAPVIEVSGRSYPVEIRYRPLQEITENTQLDNTFTNLKLAVDELLKEPPGDILVFLSTEGEIKDAKESLNKHLNTHNKYSSYLILPLYGRLSAADQHQIFKPAPAGINRKIILSTNIAETSITVPGIKYVIDNGLARISRWNPRTKVQRLPIEAVSRASAIQRSGRCGRTSPGIAIRLYSEEDFLSRSEFTEAEILRTGLASVLLKLYMLGVNDPKDFDFLSRPDNRGISEGISTLKELGAISKTKQHDYRLSKTGWQLTKIPIDPRLGKMLIEADKLSVLAEVSTIVAAISVQDAREWPEDKKQQAEELHNRFIDPKSDFISILNLYKYLKENQENLSGSAFRRLCKQEFIHYLRVKECFDLIKQLEGIYKQVFSHKNNTNFINQNKAMLKKSSDADAIHIAILSGVLSHSASLNVLAKESQDRQSKKLNSFSNKNNQSSKYLGTRGTSFRIFPGSKLAKKPPEFIMALELVETSQLFARTVAEINPEWIYNLAKEHCTVTFSDIYWSTKQACAMIKEKISLWGLNILTDKKAALAKHDSVHARELFIKHALIKGEWYRKYNFINKNYAFRKSLQEKTNTSRLAIWSEEQEYEFYARTLPLEVVSGTSFDKWYQKQLSSVGIENLNSLLCFSENSPEFRGASDLEKNEEKLKYPNYLTLNEHKLKIKYLYKPQANDDGMNILVPISLLSTLREFEYNHLVPPLQLELITALIRSLPKATRKSLVPAPEWAKTCFSELKSSISKSQLSNSFYKILANYLSKKIHQSIFAEDFNKNALPSYLKPHFKIINEHGTIIASGDDITKLQEKYAHKTKLAIISATESKKSGNSVNAITYRNNKITEQKNIDKWIWEDLPKQLGYKVSGAEIALYPTLIVEKNSTSINLELRTTLEKQFDNHFFAMRNLLLLNTVKMHNYFENYITQQEKLLIAGSEYKTLKNISEDIFASIADSLIIKFMKNNSWLSTKEEFDSLLNDFNNEIVNKAFDILKITLAILAKSRDIKNKTNSIKQLNIINSLNDVTNWLKTLLAKNFISGAGSEQINRFIIYLNALEHRLDKIVLLPTQDAKLLFEYQKANNAFIDAGGKFEYIPRYFDKLWYIRWQLEELRVSLFAQHLGTINKISVTRIIKQLNDI